MGDPPDLEPKVGRGLAVIDPLEVVIDNWPSGETFWRDVPVYPQDTTRDATRKLPFSGRLFIERSDFAMDPPKGFHRLAPGREGDCAMASSSNSSRWTPTRQALRCVSTVPTTQTRSAAALRTEGRFGAHCRSSDHAVEAEFRIYDRLFSHESPGSDGRDFKEDLNPSRYE